MCGPTADVQTWITAVAATPRPGAVRIGVPQPVTLPIEAAGVLEQRPDMEQVPDLREPIQVYREVRANAPIRTVLPRPAVQEHTILAGPVVPETSIAVREGPTGVRDLPGPTDPLQDPPGATGVRVAEAAALQGATGVPEEAGRPAAFGAAEAAVALQVEDPLVEDPAEGPVDVEECVNSRLKNRNTYPNETYYHFHHALPVWHCQCPDHKRCVEVQP